MYTLWHHMIQLQLSSNIECVEMYLHRLSQWAAEEVEGLTTISRQDNNISSIHNMTLRTHKLIMIRVAARDWLSLRLMYQQQCTLLWQGTRGHQCACQGNSLQLEPVCRTMFIVNTWICIDTIADSSYTWQYYTMLVDWYQHKSLFSILHRSDKLLRQ